MGQEARNCNNKNSTLNLLKGFSCIGVVFIHVVFPGLFGKIISTLSQFAVPIFLMIAGYFAYGCDEFTIKRRLYKILKIFIIAYLFFFAYNALNHLIEGTLLAWIKVNYTLKALAKIVVFCTVNFAIPLWYLIAMLETYVLWFFIVKWKKEKFMLKLMPFLFLLGILLTTICETNNYEWFWKINFVTRALSWFLLGYFVHTVSIEKINNIVLFGMSVLGITIALIPVLIDTAVNFSNVGLIPYSVSLFLYAIKYPQLNILKPVEFIGEKLSLNIYIFHVLIAGVIGFVLSRVGININADIFLWIKPVITLAATIVFSYCIYKFKDIFKHAKS